MGAGVDRKSVFGVATIYYLKCLVFKKKKEITNKIFKDVRKCDPYTGIKATNRNCL